MFFLLATLQAFCNCTAMNFNMLTEACTVCNFGFFVVSSSIALGKIVALWLNVPRQPEEFSAFIDKFTLNTDQ